MKQNKKKQEKRNETEMFIAKFDILFNGHIARAIYYV